MKPPDSYTLAFDGQGGVAGFGKGSAQVSLTPARRQRAASSSYTVQAQVGGKIAQVGQRLIDGVAKSMAEDFFRRFDEEMQRRHPQAYAAAAAAQPAAAASLRRRPASRFLHGCGSWAPCCWWRRSCGGCARERYGKPRRHGAALAARLALGGQARAAGDGGAHLGLVAAADRLDHGAVRGRRGGRVGLGRLHRGRPDLPLHRRGGAGDPDRRSGLREVRHHRRRGAPLRAALRRHAGTAAGVRSGRRRAGRTRRRAGTGAPDAAHGAGSPTAWRRWTRRRRPAR